jgi:hypothetical protein
MSRTGNHALSSYQPFRLNNTKHPELKMLLPVIMNIAVLHAFNELHVVKLYGAFLSLFMNYGTTI